jgi:cytochrome bd-type quinol oxidase subunit 2
MGAVFMERTQKDIRSQHLPHYRNFLVMAALSFGAMYVLMYAMVDQFANVHANLNQAYMAALMAASMVLIELLVMRRMYRNARVNAAIVAVSAIVLVASFSFIRAQVGISDKQFLRSMIPHHAAAILMCEQASVRDLEIKTLCEQIKTSQQAEIDQMRAKLNALER